MKILIDLRFLDYVCSGGIENVAYYLIESLKNRNVKIILDVRASSKKIYEKIYSKDQNINIISDPIEGIYHNLKLKSKFLATIVHFFSRVLHKVFGIELFRRRKKWANSIKTDVVIYPNHLDDFQHFNIPSISFVHAILPNYDKRRMKFIEERVENANALISLWHYPYNEFINKYPQRKNSWYLIPMFNTVNINHTKQETVNWIKNPYWLDVNFYTERKNRLNLVNAYKLAYEKNNNIPDLIMVGKGKYEYFKDVKNLINKLKISSKIKAIYDFLPASQISYLYHNAKAILAPTLWEAASGSALEATLCGKPVACSNVPPLKDFADWFDLKMLFFYPKDINNMADKLLELDNNYKIYKKWGRENQQKIKKYDINYYGDEIMKVINTVTSSNNSEK